MYIVYIYICYLFTACFCNNYVCAMGELFAKVNFQKYVFVRQFFQNIETNSHDMYHSEMEYSYSVLVLILE